MGKHKDGDKKKGPKIPKEVAGVKLPKAWRKGGEALIAQAQSPAGRAAIAQGVTVVAGLAASVIRAAGEGAAAKQPAKAAPTGDPAADAGKSATPPPDAIAQAMGAGVEAVLGRLFQKR